MTDNQYRFLSKVNMVVDIRQKEDKVICQILDRWGNLLHTDKYTHDYLESITGKALADMIFKAAENGDPVIPYREILPLIQAEPAPVVDNAAIYKAAKKHFGTTSNPLIAGFLNVDGSMLDFSWGKGYRGVDHREIDKILDVYSGTEAMYFYMSLGNIRLKPEAPGLEMKVEPTEAQYKAIKKYATYWVYKEDRFYVEFTSANDNRQADILYDASNIDDICLDIRAYYKNGKLPKHKNAELYEAAGNSILDTEYLQLAKEYLNTHEEHLEIRLRKLLDNAAYRKGYNTIAYHGTPFRFNDKFKGSTLFFSDNKDFAYNYAETKAFDNAMDSTPKVFSVYLNTNNLFNAYNRSHTKMLLQHLPKTIGFGFGGKVIDKTNIVKLLQGYDTIQPLWDYEKIKDKKFGDHIGDNRHGYCNDIFVGFDNQDNVVTVSNTFANLLQLVTRKQIQQLIDGEDIHVTGYVYGNYVFTEEEYLKQKERYNANSKQEIPYWFWERESRTFRPCKHTLKAYDVQDQDTWTYYELTTVILKNDERLTLLELIKRLGFKGIVTSEDGCTTYVLFNNRDVKLADLITYKDGEIIPLSKRFNRRTSNINESYLQGNDVLNQAGDRLGIAEGIADTGFINPDGTQIHIEEYDHKSIINAFFEPGRDYSYYEDLTDLMTTCVSDYIALGAIRLETEWNGIQIGKIEPTEAQYNKLVEVLEFYQDTYPTDTIYVEFIDNEGVPLDCLAYQEYNHWTTESIINDIKKYFNKPLVERKFKDDLYGKQFGELTVLEPDDSSSSHSKRWLCQCSCGKIVSVSRKHLLAGETKACGHLKPEAARKAAKNFIPTVKKNKRYNTNLGVIANQKMQPNNTSGVKGVDYHKSRQLWRGRVKFRGREITKWFKNKEDAIAWREWAEKKYYQPIIDKARKAGDLKESFNYGVYLSEDDFEPFSLGGVTFPDEDWHYWIEPDDREYQYFGIMDGNTHVGDMAIQIDPERKEPLVILEGIRILDKYQKQGYGRAAIEELIDYVKHTYHNVRQIALRSVDEAIEFYHKLGFKRVGGRGSEIHMRLRLY